MSEGAPVFAELPLLVWLSPAFPVGGFAYSHGLEAAVDAGLAADESALEGWIGDLLGHGSIRQDAMLLAAAWTAAVAEDAAALVEANDLALALSPSRERRFETAAMGNAFATALRATWPEASVRLPAEPDVAYPIAVGAASAAAGLPLGPTLEAFAMAFVATLVSAVVRLGPIGQTGGQRITARLVPAARRLAHVATVAGIDGLGACGLRSDIAAMHHETLYSRLFRS